MQNEIVGFFIISSLYLTVLIASQFLHNKGLDVVISRKVAHILGTIVAAISPLFINPYFVLIQGIIFFIVLLVTSKKKILDGIHSVNGETIGAFLFPISIVICALLIWPINVQAYMYSMLVFGFSDGLACVIGTKYGKIKYKIMETKTIEGSIVFFVITFIIISYAMINNSHQFFPSLIYIIISSLIITIIEAIFGKGWDNLFVPIISGLLLIFML